jgi:hypothetical protein
MNAIEGFVNIALIATGLLQILALQLTFPTHFAITVRIYLTVA